MDSGGNNNSVSYCCVWKAGRALYTYNNNPAQHQDLDKLAASCLEMAPPYHQWYFQTVGRYTFGFLMDCGFVYFAIVHQSLGNSHFLTFLEKLRYEFARRSVSSLDSLCLQQQFFPVVARLVASLQQQQEAEWSNDGGNKNNCSQDKAQVDDEAGGSTKMPLLGKPTKQDTKKKKMMMMKMNKEHDVVVAIETGDENHRRRSSSDSEIKLDQQPSSQLGNGGTSSTTRIINTTNNKANTQNLRKKLCRQVRIVLAMDAAVCLLLFVIWLVICHGIECIR